MSGAVCAVAGCPRAGQPCGECCRCLRCSAGPAARIHCCMASWPGRCSEQREGAEPRGDSAVRAKVLCTAGLLPQPLFSRRHSPAPLRSGEQAGSAPARTGRAPLSSVPGSPGCLSLASVLALPEAEPTPARPQGPPARGTRSAPTLKHGCRGRTFSIRWPHVALSIKFPPPGRTWGPAAWPCRPFPGATCPFLLPVVWDVLPALPPSAVPPAAPSPDRLSPQLSPSASVSRPRLRCPLSTALLPSAGVSVGLGRSAPRA